MLQDWESLYQEITQDYYLSKVSFAIKDRNDEKVISSIWDDIPDSIKNNLTKLNWMDIKTYADQYYVEDRKPFIAIIETSKDRYAIDIALMDENKILLYASFNLTLDESESFESQNRGKVGRDEKPQRTAIGENMWIILILRKG